MAERGIAKLKSEKPDLVVTDVMMPKVNGLEIAKFNIYNSLENLCLELKGIFSFPYARVLMISFLSYLFSFLGFI